MFIVVFMLLLFYRANIPDVCFSGQINPMFYQANKPDVFSGYVYSTRIVLPESHRCFVVLPDAVDF